MSTRILVTTGPESSGKTTLARQLSHQLRAPLVTEAARDYLQALYVREPGAVYGEQDLLAIARLQWQREQEALAKDPGLLICDTDLLVIVIWSEVKYGSCARALLELFAESLHAAPRHYLLCDHDIPWEPDPLREHPHSRESLAQRYIDRLQQLSVPVTRISGSPQQRLQQALVHTGLARV